MDRTAPRRRLLHKRDQCPRGRRARFTAFEKWTSDHGLRWAGVGLDIEPSLRRSSGQSSRGIWLPAAAALLRRCFDSGSVNRARSAYSALIGRIQSEGYRVETYQFPFLADERKVHSTLLERLFGIVDIHGNREVLMTYSSFNHAIDSALVWAYGRGGAVGRGRQHRWCQLGIPAASSALLAGTNSLTT